MKIFDRNEWDSKIENPFWYEEVHALIQQMMDLKHVDNKAFNASKDDVYSYFEKALREDRVFLGTSGKKWDSERKVVDTIVIHHTSNPEGLTKERLSAIELIRLYAPAYAKRKIKEPIYSDHIRDGKQVFYPYHWLIRSNGVAERLLSDDEIGWHAGNWDINTRSVAICLDDDHEFSIPDKSELNVIAKLIRDKYPNVAKARIYGHREINPKTTCPSDFFLSTAERKGWKEDLLELIFNR